MRPIALTDPKTVTRPTCMKSKTTSPLVSTRLKGALLSLACALPGTAFASIFKGEALDKIADVMTWIVLVIAPVVAIGVFLLVHILPEKIAEKKQHPQTPAIQCLCLLSLFFGGLLWPLAWLWAYSKPVMYKMAYGTDKAPLHKEDEALAVEPTDAKQDAKKDDAAELTQLRTRIAELETKLAGSAAVQSAKG
jgi:CBS domain containing-hemolysin-like protein